MTKSIIKEMFYGNAGRYDTVKLSDEFFDAQRNASEALDNLIATLNKEQQELCAKLEHAMLETETKNITDHFVEGFRFGVLLGLELVRY